MATIRVNNFKCRYEISGNLEAKETVVFVNGIANPFESWDQVKIYMDQGFKILNYDLRGQWFSEVTEGVGYSFRTMAEDLYLLMEELDIPNAHIVGTSLGGEIALWFQLLHPQKVKSLSVIASAPETSELLKRQVWRWKAQAQDALSLVSESKDPETTIKKVGDKFYQGFLPDIYGNKYMEDHIELIESRGKVFSEICSLPFFKGHIKLCDMVLRLRSDEKLTPHLIKISCPVLIVAGELDIIKPVKYSKMMHDKIPGAELIVMQDTGHAIFYEKPDELGFSLLQFLSKHSEAVTMISSDSYSLTENMLLN